MSLYRLPRKRFIFTRRFCSVTRPGGTVSYWRSSLKRGLPCSSQTPCLFLSLPRSQLCTFPDSKIAFLILPQLTEAHPEDLQSPSHIWRTCGLQTAANISLQPVKFKHRDRAQALLLSRACKHVPMSIVHLIDFFCPLSDIFFFKLSVDGLESRSCRETRAIFVNAFSNQGCFGAIFPWPP